jgi:hypothetical protein
MTTLSSRNGFKRVAEAAALHFSRENGRELSKIAAKQTFDIGQFQALGAEPAAGVRIAGCEITETTVRGQIQSKGRTIRWEFALTTNQRSGVSLIPEALNRSGLVRLRAASIAEDLRFTGTTEIDGQSSRWELAPGMLGYVAGPHKGQSWVWAQCNTFVNDRGEPVYAIFEGLSVRPRLAGFSGISLPRLSCFYFHYQGKEYRLNRCWDALHSRSTHDYNEWVFQADDGDLSFRGKVRAEHRDLAGTTYEDTDGSLLHGSNAQMADMTLSVYRRGKLEASLTAKGSAGFEVVGRDKNPYVPALV